MTRDQMLDEYNLLGFTLGMGLVLAVVERKSDGVRGTLNLREEDGVRSYSDFQEA